MMEWHTLRDRMRAIGVALSGLSAIFWKLATRWRLRIQSFGLHFWQSPDRPAAGQPHAVHAVHQPALAARRRSTPGRYREGEGTRSAGGVKDADGNYVAVSKRPDQRKYQAVPCRSRQVYIDHCPNANRHVDAYRLRYPRREREARSRTETRATGHAAAAKYLQRPPGGRRRLPPTVRTRHAARSPRLCCPAPTRQPLRRLEAAPSSGPGHTRDPDR